MCEQLKKNWAALGPVQKDPRAKLDETWSHRLQIPRLRPHSLSGSSVCLLLVKDRQLTPKSHRPQAAPPLGFPGE